MEIAGDAVHGWNTQRTRYTNSRCKVQREFSEVIQSDTKVTTDSQIRDCTLSCTAGKIPEFLTLQDAYSVILHNSTYSIVCNSMQGASRHN